MTGERSVQIGRDAQGNLLVTGDDNPIYVLLGKDLSADLLAQLQSGTRRVQDLPQAVPLPTLILHIAPVADDADTWQLTATVPATDQPPRPWTAGDTAPRPRRSGWRSWFRRQPTAPASDAAAEARQWLEQGLVILRRLQAESWLTAEQEGWIGIVEQMLRELE